MLTSSPPGMVGNATASVLRTELKGYHRAQGVDQYSRGEKIAALPFVGCQLLPDHVFEDIVVEFRHAVSVDIVYAETDD